MKNTSVTLENLDKHMVELSRLYPISLMWPIRRNAIFIFITLLFGLVVLISMNTKVEFFESIMADEVGRNMMQLAFIILSGACLIRLTYDLLQCLCFKYNIEGEHIAISKGIIIKHGGAFPLCKITDIYLERRLLDVIFGLCTVDISTPTAWSHHFAKIEGLRMHDARALQGFLTSLVEGLRLNSTMMSGPSVPPLNPYTNGQRPVAINQSSVLH